MCIQRPYASISSISHVLIHSFQLFRFHRLSISLSFLVLSFLSFLRIPSLSFVQSGFSHLVSILRMNSALAWCLFSLTSSRTLIQISRTHSLSLLNALYLALPIQQFPTVSSSLQSPNPINIFWFVLPLFYLLYLCLSPNLYLTSDLHSLFCRSSSSFLPLPLTISLSRSLSSPNLHS